METLFRFVLARPAIAQSESAPSVSLGQDSPLQAALGRAAAGRNERDESKAAAREFVASPGFVSAPEALSIAPELRALRTAFDALEESTNADHDQVVQAVEEAFGVTPLVLAQRGDLAAPVAALRDSLLAIKLLPEEHGRPLEELARQLRDLETISKIATDEKFPGTGAVLHRFRRRSILLPGASRLGSVLSTSKWDAEERQRRELEGEKRRKDAGERLTRFRRLEAAIVDLTGLGGDHLVSTPQHAQPGSMVAEALRPVQLFAADMTRIQELAERNHKRAMTRVDRDESPENPPLTERAEQASTTDLGGVRLQYGSGGFTPVSAAESGFRLGPSAESQLPPDTLALLRERGASLSAQPLDSLVATLIAERQTLARELDALFGRPTRQTLKRIGHTLLKITTPVISDWRDLTLDPNGWVAPDVPLPQEDRVPRTHGSLAPSGIADLVLVRQQLVRYEVADVAHIESILRGEKKEREHLRRRVTEEFTLRESEVTTSEERELESTSRFELARETNTTLAEDASLKAGLTLSGKYGPTVSFSASAEGSLARSKEEATKTAATFSQEVTERSANKLTERVLQRASLRMTDEVVEKSLHSLDNTAGAAHISGVYQWVNKVYQAQMWNYGLRTQFDFMVPEPGAFLAAALEKRHDQALELEKPLRFTLRPDQITEHNYTGWILLYHATDVVPPPEIYKTATLDYSAGGGGDDTDYDHSGQIAIESGYKAVFGTVGRVVNIWEDASSVDVVLGQRSNRFRKGEWMWFTALDGETGSIPFALNTYKISHVAVAVEVKCQRTEWAMQKWRHDTHAKLTQAYQARQAEYEESLANLTMQVGVSIQGKNPALNLELMQDELRKNCVSILAEHHFELFGAISAGSHGYPELDLAENAAEGPYVRFFEQAFEWEHMTWMTYPYFWGRKAGWEEKVSYEDDDPLFNQFLKAGYCRVVVPARPGFEAAIDHFLHYGEIWSGGPLPPISSPLYLPIADELAESLSRPGAEVPMGDPWLVRIPTTLVHLRANEGLPAWVENAAGEWTPQ